MDDGDEKKTKVKKKSTNTTGTSKGTVKEGKNSKNQGYDAPSTSSKQNR